MSHLAEPGDQPAGAAFTPAIAMQADRIVEKRMLGKLVWWLFFFFFFLRFNIFFGSLAMKGNEGIVSSRNCDFKQTTDQPKEGNKRGTAENKLNKQEKERNGKEKVGYRRPDAIP